MSTPRSTHFSPGLGIKALFGIGGILLCGLFALLVATWALQERVLYPFDTHGAFLEAPFPFVPAAVANGNIVPATQATPSQSVRLWHYPGAYTNTNISKSAQEKHSDQAQPPRDHVIFFPGNVGSPSMMLERAQPFIEAGWAVSILAYPGVWDTPGAPSQTIMVQHAGALIDAADTPPLIYGYSMGGAVALQTAARHETAGLYLEAPLASAWAIARGAAPWLRLAPFLLRDTWDASSVMDDIDEPIFIVHGAKDRVVPLAHGEEISLALQSPLHVVSEGEHHNLLHQGVLTSLQDIAHNSLASWQTQAVQSLPPRVLP